MFAYHMLVVYATAELKVVHQHAPAHHPNSQHNSFTLNSPPLSTTNTGYQGPPAASPTTNPSTYPTNFKAHDLS